MKNNFKFLLSGSLLFVLLLTSPVTGQIILTPIATPGGSFSGAQTVSNVSVGAGELLVLSYTDDASSGNVLSASFNATGLTSAFGSTVNVAATSMDIRTFANTTGSTITADLTFSGPNPSMYGVYVLSNVDLNVPFITDTTTASPGKVGSASLNLDLSSVAPGQLVLSTIGTGSGDHDFALSGGGIFQEATSGATGGSFATASQEVMTSGPLTLTWDVTDPAGTTGSAGIFRLAGGAVVFTPVPEPGAFALLALATGIIFVRRRK